MAASVWGAQRLAALVARTAFLLPRRTSRLLCTATQEKSTGRKLEEEPNHSPSEEKPVSDSSAKILEEKTKLEEQLKEITEKYKRALADTENLRQRTQKLVEETKLYGIQSFCKDLLEVADVLEKATESVPKEEVKDENPHLKNLYEGLAMTEVQIQKVFRKHGLIKLNPLGVKFDPYEHEALFHVPMEGKDPGTVALVSKVGYKLHGRTLRPALVGVVKEQRPSCGVREADHNLVQQLHFTTKQLPGNIGNSTNGTIPPSFPLQQQEEQSFHSQHASKCQLTVRSLQKNEEEHQLQTVVSPVSFCSSSPTHTAEDSAAAADSIDSASDKLYNLTPPRDLIGHTVTAFPLLLKLRGDRRISSDKSSDSSSKSSGSSGCYSEQNQDSNNSCSKTEKDAYYAAAVARVCRRVVVLGGAVLPATAVEVAAARQYREGMHAFAQMIEREAHAATVNSNVFLGFAPGEAAAAAGAAAADAIAAAAAASFTTTAGAAAGGGERHAQVTAVAAAQVAAYKVLAEHLRREQRRLLQLPPHAWIWRRIHVLPPCVCTSRQVQQHQEEQKRKHRQQQQHQESKTSQGLKKRQQQEHEEPQGKAQKHENQQFEHENTAPKPLVKPLYSSYACKLEFPAGEGGAADGLLAGAAEGDSLRVRGVAAVGQGGATAADAKVYSQKTPQQQHQQRFEGRFFHASAAVVTTRKTKNEGVVESFFLAVFGGRTKGGYLADDRLLLLDVSPLLSTNVPPAYTPSLTTDVQLASAFAFTSPVFSTALSASVAAEDVAEAAAATAAEAAKAAAKELLLQRAELRGRACRGANAGGCSSSSESFAARLLLLPELLPQHRLLHRQQLLQWETPIIQGETPGRRYGHSLVFADPQLILYGGRNAKGELLGDLWLLDLSHYCAASVPPCRRHYAEVGPSTFDSEKVAAHSVGVKQSHSAVAAETHIDSSRCRDDAYRQCQQQSFELPLRISKGDVDEQQQCTVCRRQQACLLQWTRVDLSSSPGSGSVEGLPLLPSPRFYHTALILPETGKQQQRLMRHLSTTAALQHSNGCTYVVPGEYRSLRDCAAAAAITAAESDFSLRQDSWVSPLKDEQQAVQMAVVGGFTSWVMPRSRIYVLCSNKDRSFWFWKIAAVHNECTMDQRFLHAAVLVGRELVVLNGLRVGLRRGKFLPPLLTYNTHTKQANVYHHLMEEWNELQQPRIQPDMFGQKMWVVAGEIFSLGGLSCSDPKTAAAPAAVTNVERDCLAHFLLAFKERASPSEGPAAHAAENRVLLLRSGNGLTEDEKSDEEGIFKVGTAAADAVSDSSTAVRTNPRIPSVASPVVTQLDVSVYLAPIEAEVVRLERLLLRMQLQPDRGLAEEAAAVVSAAATTDEANFSEEELTYGCDSSEEVPPLTNSRHLSFDEQQLPIAEQQALLFGLQQQEQQPVWPWWQRTDFSSLSSLTGGNERSRRRSSSNSGAATKKEGEKAEEDLLMNNDDDDHDEDEAPLEKRRAALVGGLLLLPTHDAAEAASNLSSSSGSSSSSFDDRDEEDLCCLGLSPVSVDGATTAAQTHAIGAPPPIPPPPVIRGRNSGSSSSCRQQLLRSGGNLSASTSTSSNNNTNSDSVGSAPVGSSSEEASSLGVFEAQNRGVVVEHLPPPGGTTGAQLLLPPTHSSREEARSSLCSAGEQVVEGMGDAACASAKATRVVAATTAAHPSLAFVLSGSSDECCRPHFLASESSHPFAENTKTAASQQLPLLQTVEPVLPHSAVCVLTQKQQQAQPLFSTAVSALMRNSRLPTLQSTAEPYNSGSSSCREEAAAATAAAVVNSSLLAAARMQSPATLAEASGRSREEEEEAAATATATAERNCVSGTVGSKTQWTSSDLQHADHPLQQNTALSNSSSPLLLLQGSAECSLQQLQVSQQLPDMIEQPNVLQQSQQQQERKLLQEHQRRLLHEQVQLQQQMQQPALQQPQVLSQQQMLQQHNALQQQQHVLQQQSLLVQHSRLPLPALQQEFETHPQIAFVERDSTAAAVGFSMGGVAQEQQQQQCRSQVSQQQRYPSFLSEVETAMPANAAVFPLEENAVAPHPAAASRQSAYSTTSLTMGAPCGGGAERKNQQSNQQGVHCFAPLQQLASVSVTSATASSQRNVSEQELVFCPIPELQQQQIDHQHFWLSQQPQQQSQQHLPQQPQRLQQPHQTNSGSPLNLLEASIPTTVPTHIMALPMQQQPHQSRLLTTKADDRTGIQHFLSSTAGAPAVAATPHKTPSLVSSNVTASNSSVTTAVSFPNTFSAVVVADIAGQDASVSLKQETVGSSAVAAQMDKAASSEGFVHQQNGNYEAAAAVTAVVSSETKQYASATHPAPMKASALVEESSVCATLAAADAARALRNPRRPRRAAAKHALESFLSLPEPTSSQRSNQLPVSSTSTDNSKLAQQ